MKAHLRLLPLLVAAALAAAAPGAVHAAPAPGELYAFGLNGAGQLGVQANSGNGTAANSTPAQVPLPAGAGAAVDAAAGWAHSLVLTSSGQVFAFGDNEYGELGNATDNGQTYAHPKPAEVTLPPGAGTVTAVAAGFDDSFLLTAAGDVYAFGYNQHNELAQWGDAGTTNPNPTPAKVSYAGSPITQMASGGVFTVGLEASGALVGWGDTTAGELAFNDTNTGIDGGMSPPRSVDVNGQRVAQVAAGSSHVLALTTSGQLYAFGNNSWGQLAQGSGPTHNPVPTLVALQGVTQIAAGSGDSFAVTATGQLYAFGDDHEGELGVDTGTNNPYADITDATPELVDIPASAGRIVQVAPGEYQTLVLTSSGQVWAFGDDEWGQLGTSLGGSDGYTSTPVQVPMPNGATVDRIAPGETARHELVIIANLSVGPGSLGAGQVGTAYTGTPTVTGGAPGYAWSATGLPPGLAIDAGTGVISGTPTTAGTFAPTITATDRDGIQASTQPQIAVAAPDGNGDGSDGSSHSGTSSSSSSSTTTSHGGGTQAPPRVSVGAIGLAGPHATLSLSCMGAQGQQCRGTIRITTAERTAKITRPRTLLIARGTYALRAGRRSRITVSLNRSGMTLLDRQYAVTASLAVSRPAAAAVTRALRFHFQVLSLPIDYYFHDTKGFTWASELVVRRVTRDVRVVASCDGGGCPFARKVIAVRKQRASVLQVLGGAHLRPGAVLQVMAFAPNAVAEILRFTIVPGALPRVAALCQTPGQKAPGVCHD